MSASTQSDLRNPDKERLRADILAMHAQGMSYRQIAREVGIHFTRVGQIVRGERWRSTQFMVTKPMVKQHVVQISNFTNNYGLDPQKNYP